MIDYHYSARAAVACGTTNTDVDTFVGVSSIGITHIQGSITATTTDALRQNTVATFLASLDITVIKSVDFSAITRFTTGAADQQFNGVSVGAILTFCL